MSHAVDSRPDLLPLEEVERRLRIVARSYAGVRPIEIARIVGSLDRSADFDRAFTPRLAESRRRLRQLRAVFPHGDVPPIEAYEVGGAYFVADGHHRVALARERAAEYIDAEVVRLQTNVELGPDADVRQLVHTEAEAELMQHSGLSKARPEAVIRFSRPGGYPELLELIKAHGFDLMQARGRLLSPEQVAADWYDAVYLPGVAALRAAQLTERYAYKTDADLFLWVYQRRRALRVQSRAAGFADAAQDASRERVSRRFRREFLRARTQPLPRAAAG